MRGVSNARARRGTRRTRGGKQTDGGAGAVDGRARARNEYAARRVSDKDKDETRGRQVGRHSARVQSRESSASLRGGSAVGRPSLRSETALPRANTAKPPIYQRQLDHILKEWTITLPPDSQRNVLDVPRTRGLLTARELDITDTVNVAILLDNLRAGQWSSVEVTTAFYRRAIIAQQLVCTVLMIRHSRFDLHTNRPTV